MNNVIDSIKLSGTVYTLSAQTSGGGVPESAFTAYTATTDERMSQDEEVTAAGLNALNDKITPTVELTQAEYDALTTKDPNTYYIITDATAFDPSTKVDTSAFTAYSAATNTALNGKVNTSSVVSSVTSASTDSEIPTAKAVWDVTSQGGGGGGKAVTGGTNISVVTGETADTINCTLPISTDTNTISINKKNVKIGTSNVTTSNFSRVQIAIGDNVTANGIYSFAFGAYAKATNYSTVSMGYRTESNNRYQASFGQYNTSSNGSSTFGDSGNTLFSVGNGTADNARHNAFEIRQNGDIYLTKDGQDIKLQDQLGGSSITVDTALDSGSTNPVENRVIYNKIDEVEQVTAAALNNINDRLTEDEEVTAAGLNAVNDKFDGLKLKKLTQAAYDALTTKDASTLYIIIN